MSNQVTIRGCYSEAGKSSWEIIEKENLGISVEENGGLLVMRGNVGSEASGNENNEGETSESETNESENGGNETNGEGTGSGAVKIIQVGNQIEIILDNNTYDKESSFWLERTDVPYARGMQANKWMDMTVESSRVFEELYGSPEEVPEEADEEALKTKIMDPPTGMTNSQRKLEFIVCLRGKDMEKNFLMLAEQNIIPNGAGEFRVEFIVYACGFVPVFLEVGKEEEMDAAEGPERILIEWKRGIGKELEIDDLLNCIRQLPGGQFEPITVNYDTDLVCRFNGWDEES